MKKLVIFDLDGTLINSIKDLGAATNFALEKNGYPTHPLDSYPMFVGNGVANLIRRALPDHARTDSNVALLKKDFTMYYDVHNLDRTVPYDGISELLQTIQSKGILIAVASNKYDEATKKLVTSLFHPSVSLPSKGRKKASP